MGRARETGSGTAMLGLLLLLIVFTAHAEGIRAPFTIAAPQVSPASTPGTAFDDADGHRDLPAVSAFRFEAGVGHCRHQLAPDASWSYREWGNYETKMNINPICYQVGVSYLPVEFDGVKVGFRASLVDLGRITANNSYPVNEQAYFLAKDTRTAVQSDTGRFTGSGSSRGLTLGLAAETQKSGLNIGAEVGLALLRNTWRVNFPNFGAANVTGCRTDWACADGNQITPYIGVNARWKYLFVSIRQYTSVHASQSEANPLFIGPTAGSVTQMTIGASVPL